VLLSRSSRIYIAGHSGMVGAAVVRLLESDGFENLIVASRQEVDLCNQGATEAFFQERKPDVVVFAAARVGGIHANSTFPAEFIYQNLVMATNSIHAAWASGTSRFLFLGSTCIYPRSAPQPISEESMLTSELEPTNEAYAIAKIAGVKMCQYYRQQYGVTFHCAMPTNLYGPGDNYHPENSHVLPGMIRRFHEAKLANADTVCIWGNGTPLREFLHVDDLAKAIVHLLSLEDPPDLVNVGSGKEITILELAKLVAKIVGFDGEISLDRQRPNGTPRKLSDISRLRSTGWVPEIELSEGIAAAYESFLTEQQQQTLRSI
jgi:GDP-L-fucose synthase